uniref:Cytochrome P450 n=1 Tax=Erpetoichthys calabaricus TaxID=27687 RepID=A0A8C4X2A9_ERPCA
MKHRKKMPFTDAVIHECQRFLDVVPLNIFHCTTAMINFRGYTIPKGTVVIPLLHSVLFDKTKWETPHSFNPGHFLDENNCFKMNPAFMPFSAGKRSCVGENLARMKLFLFFSTLLQNFTFSSTDDPANIHISPVAGSFIKLPRLYKLLVKSRA